MVPNMYVVVMGRGLKRGARAGPELFLLHKSSYFLGPNQKVEPEPGPFSNVEPEPSLGSDPSSLVRSILPIFPTQTNLMSKIS